MDKWKTIRRVADISANNKPHNYQNISKAVEKNRNSENKYVLNASSRSKLKSSTIGSLRDQRIDDFFLKKSSQKLNRNSRDELRTELQGNIETVESTSLNRFENMMGNQLFKGLRNDFPVQRNEVQEIFSDSNRNMRKQLSLNDKMGDELVPSDRDKDPKKKTYILTTRPKSTPSAQIARFVKPSNDDYPRAIREIRNGRKTSHWIWYIFPQLAIKGTSERATYYGIKSLLEAASFLNDDILGVRLMEIATVALIQMKSKRIPLRILMGSEVDAHKLLSCVTLFYFASLMDYEKNQIFNEMMDLCVSQIGKRDIQTIEFCKNEMVLNKHEKHT